MNYKPEIDITPELDAEGTALYQGYMGIFRWMIELGRTDIITAVSMLASHQVMPREGHLEACYHIFAYLRKHPTLSIIMHPSRPKVRQDHFVESVNRSDFYEDCAEEIPDDAPEPFGISVKITAFVDANHAGNLVTRRSQTGYIIFVNNAPILYYSKRQNTCESSTFGSEFIAARTLVEANDALRIKLRSFGIPIDGPTDVLCDNASVVNSGQRPESVLSKKHLSICYHKVREAVAKKSMRMGKIGDAEQVCDMFTKLVSPKKREYCLGQMCFRERHSLRDVDKDKDVLLNPAMV